MPSNLVRADQVLLHYLMKKVDEAGVNNVNIQTIRKDFQSIQEDTGVTLYEIFRQNGQLQSPELNKELRQLEGMKKIQIENGCIRPLGIGRLSGGALQLQDDIQEAINKTIDRKTVDSDK